MDKEIIAQLTKENTRLKEKLKLLQSSPVVGESWHQNIIDSLPNPIFVKNQQHQWMLVNTAFSEFIGERKEDLIGKSDFDFFNEQQATIFWEKDSEVLLNGTTNWNEEDITIDGEKSNLVTAKVRIEDNNGDKYILGIITDISKSENSQILLNKKNQEINEQKRHIETLLKEVHHRVKNNLQIVKSLLNLQMDKLEDSSMKSSFQDSINRVVSMSKVHETFYRTANFAALNMRIYLTDLLSTLAELFPDDDQRNVILNIDNLFINSDLAMYIGLIVNEIFTNSIKHFGSQKGKLEIYISLAKNNKKYTLEMGDNGPGIRDRLIEKDSLGYELISLLTDQINSVLTMPDKCSGTHYRVEFSV